MASSEENTEGTASLKEEEKQESVALEQEAADKEKREIAVKERQFELLMQQVQTEASINRVTNLHPATRHKMKNKLERSISEKMAESSKRKTPSEDLQKVFQDKADKAKADKLQRLRASFNGRSSDNTSPKDDPEDDESSGTQQ
ncbi:hypothetical protein R1flu_014594 [Riccia fluitans]|uniref:Uncharacterized protein n=1 Tax=Riccia fluitans TaxID=41844 RepID=A0ABD1YGT2_9MARC